MDGWDGRWCQRGVWGDEAGEIDGWACEIMLAVALVGIYPTRIRDRKQKIKQYGNSIL